MLFRFETHYMPFAKSHHLQVFDLQILIRSSNVSIFSYNLEVT